MRSAGVQRLNSVVPHPVVCSRHWTLLLIPPDFKPIFQGDKTTKRKNALFCQSQRARVRKNPRHERAHAVERVPASRLAKAVWNFVASALGRKTLRRDKADHDRAEVAVAG